MRLATYEYKGQVNWGVVDEKGGKVYPADSVFVNPPSTLLEYIQSGADKSAGDLSKHNEGIEIKSVKLLSPIINPLRNVFCVGKNYMEHVKELAEYDIKQFSDFTELPIFFTKATTAVNSPYGDVSMHEGITSQVDYEGELAVIIGKEGKNISQKDAYDYIFGYSVLNDFTARDLQKDHKQWVKGKSLDGYCPIGPWIVTKDEIEDPQKLDIATYVNGETRQSSNTENMIFPIARLVAELSKGMTLLPGDILATGTPNGVGAGFKPPKFLNKGDKVKVAVESIGEIENNLV